MLEQRLAELEKEFERGQAQMAALDQERAELRDTLLRISGAIQVLRELQSAVGESTPVMIPAADLQERQVVEP